MLAAIAGQISGAEIERLAVALPDRLDRHLPRHHSPRRHDATHPVPVADFVGQISSRTGLKDDEVRRGISAVLTTLRGAMDDPAYLDHVLALLPKDYRSLEAA